MAGTIEAWGFAILGIVLFILGLFATFMGSPGLFPIAIFGVITAYFAIKAIVNEDSN